MADGTITRKEIITDDALRWGAEYAKTLNEAIGKNKEFVDSIILLNAENVKLRRSENQTEFIKQKNEVKLISEQAISLIKEQQIAESSLEKVKQESLRTEKLALDVASKKQSIQKASIKLTAEERLANQEKNRTEREQAILASKTTSAYTKLNLQRTIAQRTLANLLSAENKSTAEIIVAQREFEKLDARVKAVDASTKNYTKNIGNYQSAFSGLNKTAKELLSTFGVLTGLALFGTIIKDIFNVVKDFDRQLIAVGKTTNITGEDLKQFGREVVELADNLDGITVDGLIQSAEVAGQLGVTGTANILKFSEAIEKLKLTSNIISEEQVGQFAKFIEVSSDSFENADKLASVITQLGNSFATTESEVLANATEIQKGIAVYKTSAQGVLALGAATSTLGSEAESSRSAIQSTFGVINNAIATGKNLEKILKLTGLTQKELSKQFNQDATGVFVKFVEGLSKAKSEGGNLATILNDVEISEKRAFTVVGSLAANYGILESSIAQANLEYIQNTALNKEVEAASQSIASIVADLRDKWEVYILQMNDANSGTQALTKTLKFLRDNFKEIIDFTIKAGAVFLTYVGVIKTYNFLVSVSTALQTAWTAGQISFALATGVGTKSILAQAAAARAATVTQQGLNLAVKATPWGLVLGFLLATTVAYAAFNDEMSEAEKNIQDIVDANKKLQNSEKGYASARDKNRKEDFRAIEEDIRLRKAKGENSDKLDKEEIKRKKEVLEAQIKVFSDLKTVELDRTKTEINSSNQRITQLKIEQIALEKSGYRVSKQGRTTEDLTGLIAAEKIKLNANRASFSENEKLTKEEQKRLSKLKGDLEKDAAVKDAEFKAEEDKKEKAAREKAAKEALERAKKLSDSAFEVKKQELERTIKINDEVAKNQEENDDLRLEALKVRAKAETDLVDLTKKHALDADKFVTAENKLNADQKTIIANEAAYKLIDIEKKKKEDIDKINEFDSKEYELELKRSTDFLNIGTQNAIAEEEKRFQAELALGYANDKLKEDAAKEHEKKLFDIKKAGLIAQTRLQINTLNDELNAYEAQSDGSQKSQDYILAQRAKVAELTARLIQTEGETFKANEDDKGQKAKITTEEILQISSDALGALSDLANAFSERKIQKIDDEIEKNNEFYDKQIELAGNDERQKDLLEKEREKKNDALEKKKREAKNKQAKIDKAVAIAQASIATALAVLNALNTKPFLPLGPIMATLAGVLGAVQVATIIATPIPKYKDGRKGGKSEIAWVGDGGVSEVISGPKGIDPRVTPNIPTLTHLKQGDIVHKSMADYQDYMRASILSSFQMEGRRMNDFQAKQNEEKYGKESLAVMKETLSVLKKQKHGTVINLPKIDINHHLWKQRNTNWNN